MYNNLNQTTAYKHNDASEISRTTAYTRNKCKPVISSTLTPLEEYDLKHFGKVLDEPRYYQVKDGAVYVPCYIPTSVTRRI